MQPGEQTQGCAHESFHMTSSYPRHNQTETLPKFNPNRRSILTPRNSRSKHARREHRSSIVAGAD